MEVNSAVRIDGPRGAPPLVLIGSVGSTSEMWTPIVGALVAQFRVIRIDHRGHGGAPARPAGTPSDLADLSSDVLAALDQLGLERVHLAGLSLGGMIGMWLAIHRPDRIARLALVCTSAYLPPAQGWLDRAATVRTGGMSAIAEAVVARWLTVGLAARDAELVAHLRTMVSHVDAESYAQCCEAIAAMDLRPDLGRIAAPTLVLSASQDPATPPEHGEVVAAGIAGSRFEILDDAAHVATFEQPGRIAGLLIDHFRGDATLAAGYATRRAVLGDEHVDRAIATTTPTTAPFQEFVTRYAWGDIWSRPELSRRERSIATLAALVTLGAEHELALHVRAARRNGLADNEISEVLMHTALYAGLPRGNRALSIAQDILEAPPG